MVYLLQYKNMKNDSIVVFTDGSSRGNPGPGGWGAVIVDNNTGKVWELGGREDNTTNNRMEMTAAKEALAFIESRKIEGTIEIHTDSAYLLGGVTGWVFGWEKNGWKTSTGDPVLNQDIWKELGALNFRLKSKRTVNWEKVSGHSGLRGNERVDEIATSSADNEQVLLFTGSVFEYMKLIGGGMFDVNPETATKKSSSSKKAYSYVSMVNGKIEIDHDWDTCKKRVHGESNARYKKVVSAEEERSLIAEWKALGLSDIR